MVIRRAEGTCMKSNLHVDKRLKLMLVQGTCTCTNVYIQVSFSRLLIGRSASYSGLSMTNVSQRKWDKWGRHGQSGVIYMVECSLRHVFVSPPTRPHSVSWSKQWPHSLWVCGRRHKTTSQTTSDYIIYIHQVFPKFIAYAEKHWRAWVWDYIIVATAVTCWATWLTWLCRVARSGYNMRRSSS